MRIKNKILEYVSWIPYEILVYFRRNKKSPVQLKLEKLGINEKFKVFLPNNDKGLSAQLRTFGIREPVNFKYFYNFINKDDVVLDIGANLGVFSLLSKKAKKIICIEPLKELIPYLKKNLEINKLQNKTEMINMAVGEKGKLYLEINKKMNLSKIVKQKNNKTFSIESRSLRDFVEKYGGNLIKLDVEGYEYEILYNKIPKKINKISMEFHTKLMGNTKSKELLSYFEKENFNVKYLIEDLPIRLYPFFIILKKTGILKFLTYVKRDIAPLESWKYINQGRAQKYLFLER